MHVRRKQIRQLVQNLLEKHRIRDVPVPVHNIADAAGIAIQRAHTDEELSGFLYRDRESTMAVIGVNAAHPPNRQKFTVAHELGHFLLHDFDDVHVDRHFKVWARDATSREGTDVAEREANLFAAELLMPAHMVSRNVEGLGVEDLLDERILQDLAKQFEVSAQAMTFRLANLGFVLL